MSLFTPFNSYWHIYIVVAAGCNWNIKCLVYCECINERVHYRVSFWLRSSCFSAYVIIGGKHVNNAFILKEGKKILSFGVEQRRHSTVYWKRFRRLNRQLPRLFLPQPANCLQNVPWGYSHVERRVREIIYSKRERESSSPAWPWTVS